MTRERRPEGRRVPRARRKRRVCFWLFFNFGIVSKWYRRRAAGEEAYSRHKCKDEKY